MTLAIELDTWIDEANPRQSFVTDTSLLVRGVPNERRALLQLTLPAASDGALKQASLTLHLETNPDASQRVRVLGLHQLSQEVGSETTWRTYSNKKWEVAGGDFGAEVARATLPAATVDGPLSFDVTELVRETTTTSSTTLSMVILEIDPAPALPSELAFTSLEGNASESPALLLSYCDP
jgi:hypothetical protein